jgi:hypothetical protein
MLGGTPKSVERFEPFVRLLAPAPDRGWLHCGPSGAGHFAKMIHNGIEYGMMQAFAEGFALLAARKDLEFDLGRLAETWRHGSVVRSWLLDLCADAPQRDEGMQRVRPIVAGFRRGPLDRARVGRARRARARDHHGADGALSPARASPITRGSCSPPCAPSLAAIRSRRSDGRITPA